MLRKRPFVPAEGVSNVELFYDLIFVYCISVMTSLCHHVEGFLDVGTWVIYMFSFLVVLQVWFDTTLLMNRYGDRSAIDNVCLFANMFLLYYMASGIHQEWAETRVTFNLSWALILVNVAACWLVKRHVYENLDEHDRAPMAHTAQVLLVQAAIALVAAFLPEHPSVVVSWVALLFGMVTWNRSSAFRGREARFSHIAERCSLLAIVTFGETVVAISSYLVETSSVVYPLFVFALVVGLFLIYIYEHDNMIDHHGQSDGITFMTITAWFVVILGNLTVALEYMPNDRIAFVPKSVYLMACLVLYLLSSFLLGRYNKPEFHYSDLYVAGRLGTCAFIVLVGVATRFDPLVNLIADTAAVYFALWHEWLLYHRRMGLVAFGRCLGLTTEDMIEAGYTFTTREGRRAIAEAAAEARQSGGDEPCPR